jgi:hypothetical protein
LITINLQTCGRRFNHHSANLRQAVHPPNPFLHPSTALELNKCVAVPAVVTATPAAQGGRAEV